MRHREVGELCLYIAATRTDYRLAKALIASLHVFAPKARIIVLPDDDFSASSFFGCEVWRPQDPEVLALDRFYKKLRVFWGPAERFLFFDADQLAIRPLSPLLEQLSCLDGPFFAPNLSSRLHAQWRLGNPAEREALFRERAGRPELIKIFDPEFDWTARFPFNSGEFAASRDAIDHAQFLRVFGDACRFHHARQPEDPLIGSRSALFMGDQGFLNYYMSRYRAEIELHWLNDVHWWGGHPEARRDPTCQSSPIEGAIVHWAGCPRPGPIPLEPFVPRHLAWQRRYAEHWWRHADHAGLIRDSAEHAMQTLARWGSKMKQTLWPFASDA